MSLSEKTENEAGVPHWKHQRRSAIILVPLTLWVVYSIIRNIGLSYTETQAWIANPVVAFLLIIFVSALFFHAKLGLQVIIEDYIADLSARQSILRISNFVCWVAIFVGVASILKIVVVV